MFLFQRKKEQAKKEKNKNPEYFLAALIILTDILVCLQAFTSTLEGFLCFGLLPLSPHGANECEVTKRRKAQLLMCFCYQECYGNGWGYPW